MLIKIDNDKYLKATTMLNVILLCFSLRMCCQYKIVLWYCRPHASKNINRTLIFIRYCRVFQVFMYCTHFHLPLWSIFFLFLLFYLAFKKKSKIKAVFRCSGFMLVFFLSQIFGWVWVLLTPSNAPDSDSCVTKPCISFPIRHTFISMQIQWQPPQTKRYLR